MWQERNRIEHPLIFVGLEMKCLLRDGCSGRSACLYTTARPRNFHLRSKLTLTCLSPSILCTTSAASPCFGVWGSGSAAARL